MVGARSPLLAALAGAVLLSLGAIALIGHQAASQTGAEVMVSPPVSTFPLATQQQLAFCMTAGLLEGVFKLLGGQHSPGAGVPLRVTPVVLIGWCHLSRPAELPPLPPQSAGLRAAGGGCAADHGAYSCVEADQESRSWVLSRQVSRQPGIS